MCELLSRCVLWNFKLGHRGGELKDREKGKKRKREKIVRITAYTGCFGVYTNDMIKREKKV